MTLEQRVAALAARIRNQFNTALTNKLGAANGIATLGADGILTLAQRPLGGSVTPLAYLAPPADTDPARQAFLVALQTDLIAKGLMLAPPTYIVSGQIIGPGNDNVALALVGVTTYNTTTDGSGNFSFPAVPDGTYTLTPTKTGYYFTPPIRSVVVSGANITAQNFVSAVSTASSTVSLTKVYVPQINVVNYLRSVQKSPRALNTELYPAVTTNVYTPTYHNGRVFLPTQDGRVLVYDDNDVLRTTISPAIGAQIFAVHAVGTKLCLIGSSHVQFGTYSNGSPDVWTPGNKVTNAIYPHDSMLFNGEVWITGGYSVTPIPHNVIRYNMNTEAFVRSNLFTNANLRAICAGDTTIVVQNASTGTISIIDPVTLNTVGVGSLTSAFANPNNISYAQGKFWITINGTLYALTPAGAVNVGSYAANGCVADAEYVYVFASNNLVVINAATNAVDGSPVTGLTTPAYFIQ